MTVKQFVEWAQGYYAPYPAGQRADVIEYLAACAPAYLDALKASLLRTFSPKYGKAPAVADFEEAKPEALETHSKRIDPTRYAALPEPADDPAELVMVDWETVFRRALEKSREATRGP